MSETVLPIIDSHIHLFPETELGTLAWHKPESGIRQRSVAEYDTATGTPPNLEGFIFVETDRKHDVEADAPWEGPLLEVDWVKRIALGTPRPGEGHVAADQSRLLAIVPWAPLPDGPAALERYLAEVERMAAAAFPKIRGFRYIVQDKPRGVMLTPEFVDGLKWLGRKGYVFDVAINQNPNTGGAKWQLEEAVEMIKRAHEGVPEEEKVAFILNHLLKPNLHIYNPSDPSFVAWRKAMFELGAFSKTYIKLSGCFSEMPAILRAAPVEDIFLALLPYLTVLVARFGAARIMFASDWPVCAFETEDAWHKWHQVVARFCDVASLDQADRIMIWSGTAIKAYGITELL